MNIRRERQVSQVTMKPIFLSPDPRGHFPCRSHRSSLTSNAGTVVAGGVTGINYYRDKSVITKIHNISNIIMHNFKEMCST